MRHPIEQQVANRVAGRAVTDAVRRSVAVPARTFVGEIVLMAAIFVGYRQIRILTHDETDVARANAQRVLDIQSGWFLSERSVQALALRSETVIGLLNRYYVGVHFPITIAFVLWLLLRHPGWYREIRNWMIAVTGAALAIHVAFPLAPPRMLAGFVDTLDVYGPDIYPTDHTQSVANQFAAMPSLHFGWSVMVAVGLVLVVRSRWRWIALVHPVVTLVAIVATANHFWLDAAVAGVLVAGFAVPTVVRARRHLGPRDVGRPVVAAAAATSAPQLLDEPVAVVRRTDAELVARCRVAQRTCAGRRTVSLPPRRTDPSDRGGASTRPARASCP